MSEAYTKPSVIFLTTDSSWPVFVPAAPPPTSLTQVSASLQTLEHTLSNQLLAPAEFEAQIQPVLQALATTAASLQAEWTSLTTIRPAVARLTTTTGLDDATVIDNMFRVHRVDGMSPLQFAAQLTRTCQDLLRDLPYAPMNLDEVIALVQAARLMFWLVVEALHVPAAGSSAPAASNVDNPLKAAWTSPPTTPEDRTAQVASYRWLVGHHFFFLCTLYCTHYVTQTCTHLEQGNEESAAVALQIATQFLRSTTSAMWYAVSLPAAAYRNYIRPEIVRLDTGEGLSGTEMNDYKHLHHAKDRLKTLILERYGDVPRQWPQPIYVSCKAFYDIYIQDMEHHTLLAAGKVAQDTSLGQKNWIHELPPEAYVKTGVEVLREMGALRQEEFPF